MIDPRDETPPGEDLLTEASDDEMKDLLKEFEARYKSLKQKRKEKGKENEDDTEYLAKLHPEKLQQVAPGRLERISVKKESTSGQAEAEPKRASMASKSHIAGKDASRRQNIAKERSKKPVIEVTGSPPRKPRLREDIKKELPLQRSGESEKLKSSLKPLTSSSSSTMSNTPKTHANASNANTNVTNFLSKLYESSTAPTSSIDYDNRKFKLDIPEPISLDVDELEPATKQYLRKRYISQKDVDQLLADVKLLRVDKLLAKVHRTNDYAEPEYTNWCLCGMVLKKQEPQTSRDGKQKWMKVTIGDFSRSVDVMLFDDAFSAYWKLRVGDVVYILNPLISKYSFGNTGGPSKTGFTLKLVDHNVGSVLEVGASRDFGVCEAVKKDGSTCGDVHNKKKSLLCDYHMEYRYHAGNKRMELNGSVQMREPGRPGGQFSHKKESKSRQFDQSRQFAGQFDRFAGNYTTYNEQTRIFASESAFSKDKYDDPRALLTAADKRRRLNDQKAKEALEARLLQHSSQHKTAERLNLLPAKVVDGQKLADGKHRLFPNGMISKIGFDPTVTLQAARQPSTKQQELARMRELNELSSSMSAERNLASSTEDQRQRSELWKKNVRDRKQYNKKVGEAWGKGAKKEESTKKASTVPSVKVIKEPIKYVQKSKILGTTVETDLDSDSDIDIDFGARAKEYEEKIKKLQGKDS